MFEYNRLLRVNFNSTKKIIVNQGGTSSGKTYNILECLILKLIQSRNIATVVGQDIPNLKKGAIRDITNICGSKSNAWLMPYLRGGSFTKAWNISERILHFANGSVIEFQSYMSEQDARSGKRDYLFINEANGVDYEIFWQLFIRTAKQTYLDYNPSAKFWVHDKILLRQDAELIISDHRSNTHIPQSLHDEIEAIDDPEMFNIYARGKTGKVKGLVFSRWGMCQTFPENCKRWVYGMDFGYSNSFTALIKIGLFEGDLYLQEVIYERGLQNEDILRKLGEINYNFSDLIVCDSNEPKTKDWLAYRGVNIWPTRKGSDANPNVNYGISLMKSHKIWITEDSTNLKKEFERYAYKKGLDGEPINEPIKLFDHGIDASRYGSVEILGDQLVFGYG